MLKRLRDWWDRVEHTRWANWTGVTALAASMFGVTPTIAAGVFEVIVGVLIYVTIKIARHEGRVGK